VLASTIGLAEPSPKRLAFDFCRFFFVTTRFLYFRSEISGVCKFYARDMGRS